jgi:diacylglycerol O-acyltransferase
LRSPVKKPPEKRPLNALDRTFLAGESRESMMHVGALLPFTPPSEGARDFHRQLMEDLRRDATVQSPWNLKLRHPDLLSSPFQAWVPDTSFDLEYHVRRSALPTPGGERELGILVSRLHSNPIDFHRPPWEVHLIEGLERDRFAIYFKVHHSLVDGFTGMRMLARSLSANPDERDTPMFFSVPSPPAVAPAARETSGAAAAAPNDESPATMDALLLAVRAQTGAAKDVGRALLNVARSVRAKDGNLVSPLQAPRSILNQRVSRSRRFATQSFELERLRRVAKRAGGTVNDVVLALLAGALRRFLREQGALPEKTLTAMLPVNVRPKDDPGGGNAVGAILASLATDIAGPSARLAAIIASTTHAKEQLQGMSKDAIMQYGALLIAPLLLSMIPGAAGRVRPAFNVVVSNVPGPDAPLYFRGWRLEATYPVSIPFHGHALNITVSGYAGTIGFGFVGCRDAIPHLQRLAVYAADALEDLESASGD